VRRLAAPAPPRVCARFPPDMDTYNAAIVLAHDKFAPLFM
jgi:hypothetical protein